MEPKVELYTAICTAMDRKDAKTAIWEILSGYAITATAACSSLEDSIAEFLAAKRADSLSEKSIRNYRSARSSRTRPKSATLVCFCADKSE